MCVRRRSRSLLVRWERGGLLRGLCIIMDIASSDQLAAGLVGAGNTPRLLLWYVILVDCD
jgi:hypothetical protein